MRLFFAGFASSFNSCNFRSRFTPCDGHAASYVVWLVPYPWIRVSVRNEKITIMSFFLRTDALGNHDLLDLLSLVSTGRFDSHICLGRGDLERVYLGRLYWFVIVHGRHLKWDTYVKELLYKLC